MIQTKFGVPGLSITEEQYQLIYSILAYYCQSQKNQHHVLLINILSFLPLEVILRRISFLNRKLYIVSGDMQLLTQYRRKQQSVGERAGLPTHWLHMSEEAFSAKFPRLESDSMHSNLDERSKNLQ